MLTNLRRHPGLNVAIIATLGVALAATVLVSGLIETCLLKPLPHLDDREVMLIEEHESNVAPGQRNRITWDTAIDVRAQLKSFSEIGVASNASFTVHGKDATEVAYVPMVSAEFFPLLKIKAARGEVINPSNAELEGQPALLLSDSLWRRRFGADPDVVGRSVQMDDQLAYVVGVLPANVQLPELGDGQQAWLAMNPEGLPQTDRQFTRYFLFARLALGISAPEAKAEVRQLGAMLRISQPLTNASRTLTATPLRDVLLGPFARQLWVLLITAGLVLLVACLNSGALLLAQALERRREFAVRLALGARPGHLLRQFWAENLTLTLIASGLAVLLADWMGPLLLKLLPENNIAAFASLSMNGLAWLIAVLTAIGAALLFGLMPWAIARGLPLESTLRGGGRAVGSRFAGRFSRWLVTGQIGVALALAIAAGLLVVSSRHLAQTDYGFPTEELFQFRVGTRGDAFNDDNTRLQLFENIRERVAQLPGVTQVSLAGFSYPNPPVGYQSFVQEGDGLTLGETPKQALLELASPEFAQTHDVRLLHGRFINAADRTDHPQVVLINASLAERYWPAGDAVGKRVRINTAGDDWWEIVGVISDRLSRGHRPQVIDNFITPFAQITPNGAALFVRFAGPQPPAFSTLQRTVWSLDPDVSIFFENRVSEFYRTSAWQQQFSLVLISAFAALAVTLCCAGLHAMLSFSVASRTRELGVRAALGASGAQIRQHVMRDAAKLIGPGLVFGLLLAGAAGQGLRGLLYGVPALSPGVFTITAGLIAIVCVIAALQPALRAAKVDPAEALRSE